MSEGNPVDPTVCTDTAVKTNEPFQRDVYYGDNIGAEFYIYTG
jgi:hypothetical protein